MGKSASGKDTIYDRLLHKEGLPLLPYVGYTTRPIRAGEQDGVEYYFTTKEDLDRYKEAGKLIESRVYHTVYGDWYYYSVDSDRVDLSRHDYLYIGTLESYVQGYAEMCRRFLADSEDFSEENLQKAGIKKRFENTNLDTCIEAIKQEIREMGALS